MYGVKAWGWKVRGWNVLQPHTCRYFDQDYIFQMSAPLTHKLWHFSFLRLCPLGFINVNCNIYFVETWMNGSYHLSFVFTHQNSCFMTDYLLGLNVYSCILSKSHVRWLRSWGRFCRSPNSLHMGFTFLTDANTSNYFYNYFMGVK